MAAPLPRPAACLGRASDPQRHHRDHARRVELRPWQAVEVRARVGPGSPTGRTTPTRGGAGSPEPGISSDRRKIAVADGKCPSQDGIDAPRHADIPVRTRDVARILDKVGRAEADIPIRTRDLVRILGDVGRAGVKIPRIHDNARFARPGVPWKSGNVPVQRPDATLLGRRVGSRAFSKGPLNPGFARPETMSCTSMCQAGRRRRWRDVGGRHPGRGPAGETSRQAGHAARRARRVHLRGALEGRAARRGGGERLAAGQQRRVVPHVGDLPARLLDFASRADGRVTAQRIQGTRVSTCCAGPASNGSVRPAAQSAWPVP
jgi:hypothetical protein